jgi:methyl-accepting chemotaxis protein
VCHRTIKQDGDFWKVSWSEDGQSRAHVVFPVVQKDGKQTGVIYAVRNITAQAEAAKSVIYKTMFTIVATMLVVALAIGGLLDVLVFKRLNSMIVHMEELSLRVAGGDFNARYEATGSNDEIGQFEAFFSRFLDLMTSTLRSLVDK